MKTHKHTHARQHIRKDRMLKHEDAATCCEVVLCHAAKSGHAAGVSRRPTKGRLGLHAINISKPEPRFIPSCTSTTNRLLPNAPRFIRFATPLRSAYVLGVVLSIDGSTCTSDNKTVTAPYQCIAVPEGLSDN